MIKRLHRPLLPSAFGVAGFASTRAYSRGELAFVRIGVAIRASLKLREAKPVSRRSTGSRCMTTRALHTSVETLQGKSRCCMIESNTCLFPAICRMAGFTRSCELAFVRVCMTVKTTLERKPLEANRFRISRQRFVTRGAGNACVFASEFEPGPVM
jgi:hypothetical protein